MTVRKYSSRAQQTTLSSPITSTASTMTVVNGASVMGGKTLTGTQTYTVVIDPDTALEEIVDVTLYSSGNTLTITRGVDGPTPGTGVAHSAGALVRHMAIGRDYQEANDHIKGTLAQHAATTSLELKTLISDETGSGSLVFGTSPTIATPTISSPTITGTGAIAGTFTGNLTGNVTGNVSGTSGSTTGNAATATALATGRTISLTGDVTGTSASFDGTGNASITAAIGTNTIVDADINASAAIAWTKIAPSSTVSTTELGYLDGVTSAIQTQIDSKLATATASSTYAPLASPALTGVPTAPTAAANTNTTQVATTAYVQTELTDLIGGAPGALDTLNELAAALADDANYSTTITTALGTKLPLAGGTMSGAIAMGTNKITGLGTPTADADAVTKAYADSILVAAPGNLTGPITSVGAATSVAAQTGTGSTFVMQASPTLTTPVLGVATATSINSTVIPTSKTLVATDSTAFVVPSQTGNTGKYLTTDGTTSSWGTVASTSAATPTALGTVFGATTGNASPYNTSFGHAAMQNTSGIENTALGNRAMSQAVTGQGNTAVGRDAMLALTGGNNNTAVGMSALDAVANGSSNAAFGDSSLGVSTGSQNTAVGKSAGSTLTNGVNNTLIGYSAAPSAVGVSNEITLGNASVTRFRIPGIGFDINRDIELMNIMGAY
jgi:hypothetical protein